jgi:hypothetical protein
MITLDELAESLKGTETKSVAWVCDKCGREGKILTKGKVFCFVCAGVVSK